MRDRITIVITLLALAATAFPADIMRGLVVKKEGHFEVDVMRIGLQVFDESWSAADQNQQTVVPDSGFPKTTAASYELRGNFNHPKGARFSFTERLTKADESSVIYDAAVSSPGMKLNSLALTVTMPAEAVRGQALIVDGSPVIIPAEFSGNTSVFTGDAKKMVIPLAGGRLVFEGAVKILIQDSRKWGPTVDVRIYFDNASGVIKNAALTLRIGYEPFDSMPLDISAQANMGFRDETDGDRTGGWTDQGPDNDLSPMKIGKQLFCGLTFDILDPAQNGGRSCLVFAGPDRGYFLKEAVIPAAEIQCKNIFLLHAIAWPPSGKQVIGNVIVTYADGSRTEHPVTKGIEVNNWWGPDDMPNGTVAWTAVTKSSVVGLFVSKFKVDDKPLASVTLRGTGKSVWMVAGITASKDAVPMKAVVPTYIVENEVWKPVEGHAAVEKGSVLDFSFMNDGPAGKYGDVVIRDGRFEFRDRPGNKVRFYGPNVCFSANYLEKPESEALAELFARTGYNCIRFHHYDREYVDDKAPNSYTPNTANIDKLDYLFHCMKQKGIYATTDLFTIRRIRPGEIAELGGRAPEMSEYKALVRLSPSAMENWKKYAALVLTHVNPYTGLAWKDDPALFSICVLNEDTLTSTWSASAETRRLAEAQFALWAKEHDVSWENSDMRSRMFMRFLVEMDIKMFREIRAYLRSLGVKAHLTDANHIDTAPLAFLRNELDFVDDHGYWDHMSFLEKQWSRPFQFGNRSCLPTYAPMPRGQFPVRIFGKPFTFTEFQYVCPNEYRSEGGTVFGAYAALQDWDGINRFAFSHSRDGIVKTNVHGAAGGFDLVNEPIGYLTEKIGLLFFLRGDVSPAKRSIPIVFTDGYLKKGDGMSGDLWGGAFPSRYSMLGLFAQAGSIVTNDISALAGYPAVAGLESGIAGGAGVKYYRADASLIDALTADGVIPAANFDLAKGAVTSETGEITLYGSNGTMSVITPRSESFVLQEGSSLSGRVLAVRNETRFATFFAAAVDGRALAESSRILLMHLTDVKNSKIKFRNAAKTIEEESGGMPMLLAYGKAAVSLTCAKAASLKVFGCDNSGRRIEEISCSRSGGTLSFTAETIKAGKAKYMVYELAEK